MPGVGKTRKRGHKMQVKTVQGLSETLDYMRKYAGELVKKDIPMSSKVKEFQVEWRKVFYRRLDAAAAESYLSFITRLPQKKQGGGSMTQGAPLNYEMQPGVYGVYGNFPAYQSSGLEAGLGFHNSQADLCGKVDTTPVGAFSTAFGSVSQNIVGGRKLRKSRKAQRGGVALINSILQHPFSSSVPSSIAYDAMASWKGLPASSSPEASQPSFSFLSSK